MPKGFGVGLRVATIPVAGVQPLSPEGGDGGGSGGAPPSSGGGGSTVGGGSSGGLGGIGLIGLLLLALGVGIPAIVASPDDEEAQVQQSTTVATERVKMGAFEAE